MHVAKGAEKKCCTCEHWAGLRALDESGFVYSLEKMEGICKGAEHTAKGAESVKTLTLPTTSCASWERWSDVLANNNLPQENNARSRAAYSV